MKNENISIECNASVLKNIVRLCNVIGAVNLYCAVMKNGNILFQSEDIQHWMMIEVLINNAGEEIEISRKNVKEDFTLPVDYLSECVGLCDGMTTLTYWPKRPNFTLESKGREAVYILRPARCENEGILLNPIGEWVSSVNVDSKRLKSILGKLGKTYKVAVLGIVVFQFSIYNDEISKGKNESKWLTISDLSRNTCISPELSSESITKGKIGYFKVKWVRDILIGKGNVEISMADIKDKVDSPLRIRYNNEHVTTTVYIAPRDAELFKNQDIEINESDW